MLYRQKAIAVVTDASGRFPGTALVECSIVTEGLVPTGSELSMCDPAVARSVPVPAIHARVPFSRTEDSIVKDISTDVLLACMKTAGIRRLQTEGSSARWYDCSPGEAVEAAIRAVGRAVTPQPAVVTPKKPAGKSRKVSHPAADALDWDEAMSLMSRLTQEGRYRDSMLIAAGCFLGLRISDLLRLRWADLLDDDGLTVTEKKTGKKRGMRINPALREQADLCYREIGYARPGDFILCSYMEGGKPFTRQRADQILKECKETFGIRSAKVFSTHSLRKTFGRRVWLKECEKGKGDQALILLQQVFGHSSIEITKRYLGIRQEEILSVYDSLA